MGIRNLANVCEEEQISFIKSFDHVLTDMDGVIWTTFKPIPGAVQCIDSLKLLGKKVNYVTNNGTVSGKSLSKLSKRIGFNIEVDEIANPILPAISFLKKLNFEAEIFAIGTQEFKDELWAADFKLAPDPSQDVEESVSSLLENIKDDENVRAVIFNYDLNLTLIKLQKVLTYLKREDCLFIVASSDRVVPIGSLGPMMGNQYFVDAITDISGRQPTNVAKPSSHYIEFVIEKFKVTNPKKVLLIGDSLNDFKKRKSSTDSTETAPDTDFEEIVKNLSPPLKRIVEDMSTAVIGGFQKLLVLTGSTQIKDIEDWKHPVEYQPEYYVDSLNTLNDILKSIAGKCT